MKNDKFPLIRFGIYTLLLLLLGGFLNYVAGMEDIRQFKEGGIVEWLQLVVLGMSAGVMFAAARRRVPGTKIFPIITAFVTLLAMVRECDALLDQALPTGGWQAPAAVLVVTAFLLAWYNRDTFGRQLKQLSQTSTFTLMWAGLAVVIYGQLTGHGPFLEPLLGDDYARNYKRLLEECLEMLGYFMLFAGSIELFFETRDQSDNP